jgi:S1-C subfamily serine protease
MGSRWISACAVLLVVLGLGACAPGQSRPTPVERPPSQVFEAAKPAVAIVEAALGVTWSVPQPDIDQGKQTQLQSRLLAMVRSGALAPTQDALRRASVQLITDDPGGWFSLTGQRYQHTDTVYVMGSGFFVSQDGYLLTNAHVIAASQDEVRRLLVSGVTKGTAEQVFVQSVRDEVAKGFETDVSDAQAQKLASWLAEVYASGLQVASITPSYRVAVGSHSAKDVENQGMPANVVAAGEAIPGKDVALLKASGGPFVTLPLSPEVPKQGAHLDVVGYPCGCTGQEDADPARKVVATLTQGSVQGELAMSSGWRATGTDARMEHGNSGGPALDSYGRVVGLATFQDTVEARGSSQTYNFVLPIEVANEFIRRAHVTAAQGPLGRQYSQAVSDFSAEHYRAALPLFQEVARADVRNPYAGEYVVRSRAAIAAGRDRTPPPTPGYVQWLLDYGYLAVFGLWGLVALATGTVFAVRRRRRFPPPEGEGS